MIPAATAATAAPGFADVFRTGPLIIASEHCKGCELCISVCPPGVLALDLDVVNGLGHHPVHLVDGARCTSCALCAKVCPDAVFTVLTRPHEIGR